MKFFNTLVFMFYTFLVLLTGMVFMAVSLGIITLNNTVELVSLVYTDASLRLLVGAGGLLLVVIGLGVMQVTLSRIHRKKSITFENPDGQISISFSAIEDFVRRLFRGNPDIKELRPVCVVSKRGIEISAKVALWQDAKIPDVTQKVQTAIKTRLHQILGIEETIVVRVNVVKIIPKEFRRAREEQSHSEDDFEIEAPYQYRD